MITPFALASTTPVTLESFNSAMAPWLSVLALVRVLRVLSVPVYRNADLLFMHWGEIPLRRVKIFATFYNHRHLYLEEDIFVVASRFINKDDREISRILRFREWELRNV